MFWKQFSSRFRILCHIRIIKSFETQDQQFLVLVFQQQFLRENTKRKQFSRKSSHCCCCSSSLCHILCTSINVIYYCATLIYSKCNLLASQRKTKYDSSICLCSSHCSPIFHNFAPIFHDFFHIIPHMCFMCSLKSNRIARWRPGVCTVLCAPPTPYLSWFVAAIKIRDKLRRWTQMK